MRTICGLAACALMVLHGCDKTDKTQDFDSFVKKYNKVYPDEAAKTEAERTFNLNVEEINAENSKGTNTFTLGVTEFTDMSTEKFTSTYLGLVLETPVEATATNHTISRATPLSEVDWRDHNAVTEVKNQNPCGTCWSFAQAGAIEGIRAIKENKLVSLSNQEMQDCLGHPCSGSGAGGNMIEGINYAKQNGLASYAAYPFIAATQSCKTMTNKELAAGKITGYVNVNPRMEDLMDALAQQPVAVALNAQYAGPIQNYRSGIISSYCSTQLDHAVLAVGYGTDSGMDYWLVKNSWGTYWGESGYFRLVRGQNECGVLSWAVYPTMN